MIVAPRFTEFGICALIVGLVISSKQFRAIYRDIPIFYTVCLAVAFLALFGGHLLRQQHLTFPFLDWRMYGRIIPAASVPIYQEYVAILDDGRTVTLSPPRVSVLGRKMIYGLDTFAMVAVRNAYGDSIPANDYNLKPPQEYVEMLRSVAKLYSKKNPGNKVRVIHVTRCWLPIDTYPVEPIRRKLWRVDLES